MAHMINEDRVQEIKDRLADRYIASELCDILEIPVEDIIEEYWARILTKPLLLEEVGVSLAEDEEIPGEEENDIS